MNLPFQLPKSTPAFRLEVLNAARRTVLQVSESGKWLDIMAVRGKDLVYIGTVPNPKS